MDFDPSSVLESESRSLLGSALVSVTVNPPTGVYSPRARAPATSRFWPSRRSSTTTIPGFLTEAVTVAYSAPTLNPGGGLMANVASPSAAGWKKVVAEASPGGISTGESERRPLAALEFDTSTLRPPVTTCSAATFRDESRRTDTTLIFAGMAPVVVRNLGT